MMKTVTYKGNVYEIGMPYLFSDDRSCWRPSILDAIDDGTANPFTTSYGCWKYIKQIPSVGKITPAPVELIDGHAYMFNYRMVEADIQGVYEKISGRFHVKEGWYASDCCTGIRKLVVAP